MNTTEIEVVNLSEGTVQTTDARNLHAKLEINKDFSNWIKAQIHRADLEEGTDYIKVTTAPDCSSKCEQETASNGVFAQKVANPEGGRPPIEYHLTLNACEHIALMSNTPKGKETRKHYISIRKQFLSDQKLAFEESALKQIEHDYSENLKHSVEYEIGAAMMGAVKRADEDSETILNKALEGVDFEGAAKASGMTTQWVRDAAISHVKLTNFAEQMKRGEHQHPDGVLDVLSFVRVAVAQRKASENLAALRKARAKRAQTLEQLDTQELIHKHDKLNRKLGQFSPT